MLWKVTYVDDPGRGGKYLGKLLTETIKTRMWWDVT
jgi:hypothetical protein